MNKILVLNDVHCGVQRIAGTTLHSANAMRAWLNKQLRATLIEHEDCDVLINGDLLDAFTIEAHQLLEVYMIFSEWLENASGQLILCRGNHDFQPKADRISSFDFLADLLSHNYLGRVVTVREPRHVADLLYVIPHMPNQDLFDEALNVACGLSNTLIMLHANYDNPFAVSADHSLNVTDEQAGALTANGNRLFFGHEHQRRVLRHGMVHIAGNQWPTSVADCLAHGAAQADGNKFAHIIELQDGPNGFGWYITPVKTWSGDNFIQWGWERLRDGDYPEADSYQFIRVSGAAHAEEAEEVVNLVSKLRKSSEAFVVANGVKIGDVEGMDELSSTTFEQIKSFNVLEALMEQLNDRERAVIQELLA